MGVQGICGIKMKRLQFLGIICTVTLFTVYTTTNYQFLQTKVWRYYQPTNEFFFFFYRIINLCLFCDRGVLMKFFFFGVH